MYYIIIFIILILVAWILRRYIIAAYCKRGGFTGGAVGAVGAVGTDIIEYLKTASIDDIYKNLLAKLSKSDICETIIGEGAMGVVRTPKVGAERAITVGKKNIILPVVIKSSKTDPDSIFRQHHDKRLYIYSYRDITAEAIMLLAVRKLWEEKRSPHLPLILDYGTCNSETVNEIVIERQGLSTPFTYEINWIDELPFWRPVSTLRTSITNSMATLGELLQYIAMGSKQCKLPNGVTCDVTTLLDYITISYLHTHDLLFSNGIMLQDMHPDNLFIHWLGESSHMGDRGIGGVEKIYYRVGKEYLGIETYGLLLKIGDIGASIYKPRKDIFVFGQCGNIEIASSIVDKIFFAQHTCAKFLKMLTDVVPFDFRKDMVSWNILTHYPYSTYDWTLPAGIKLLTPSELLSKYTKYFVPRPNENDKIIII